MNDLPVIPGDDWENLNIHYMTPAYLANFRPAYKNELKERVRRKSSILDKARALYKRDTESY